MQPDSLSTMSERTTTSRMVMRALRESPATTTMVLTMVLTFCALTIVGAIVPAKSVFLETILANSPVLVRERLWLWQLVTATFLHVTVLHLLVNVALLTWLGRRLECDMGTKGFLTFFFLASVLSYGIYDVADRYWSAWDPTTGASGCLYACATLVVLRPPARTAASAAMSLPLLVLRFALLAFVTLDMAWFLAPTWMPWVNRIVHLAGVAFALLWWLLLPDARTAHAD